MEILTAEKFDELVRKNLGHRDGAPHLFDDLAPYLKECGCQCHRFGGDVEQGHKGMCCGHWCSECKPERREELRRAGPISRRYGRNRRKS